MCTSPDGSTWTAQSTKDLYFQITQGIGTAGHIGQANSSYADARANQFMGFALAAISSSQSGDIQSSGIVGGFTGLTVGSTYYLSDTAGLISTSAGSQSRKVGIAISTTQLLIKYDNP